MAQFESRITEIKAAGAQLTFLAAEKRDGVWRPGRFLEKHPIASVFLLDEDRTVTRDYGLHHAYGADAVNIAHPATLVIDRNHWVRYIYRGDSQHDRAPLDEVIGSLQEIGK
jgi:methyl-accepting chemotaxis protein